MQVHYAMHLDMCAKPAALWLRRRPALMALATAVTPGLEQCAGGLNARGGNARGGNALGGNALGVGASGGLSLPPPPSSGPLISPDLPLLPVPAASCAAAAGQV